MEAARRENTMEKKALPTLFKINNDYRPGSDTHHHFYYLAYPFVDGPSRTELHKKKISEMKREFDKQHHGESISLIRMLLVDCGDQSSSDSLAKFDSSQLEILFAGGNVSVENREFYNFRRLLLHVVTKLEPPQMGDMVTYLQEELGDHSSVPGSNVQSLLLLFDKARQQNLIQPQNLDKLREWLEVFERADLLQEVNQFEPRKEFPGAARSETVLRQCSEQPSELSGQTCEGASVPTVPEAVSSARIKRLEHVQDDSFDSAIGDEDSRDRAGSGAPESNSLMSYQTSTDARLRSGSTEESRGPTGKSELVTVSRNTANAKNNLGTTQ